MSVIALIAAKQGLEHIRSVLPRFQERCQLRVCCYETLDEAVALYRENLAACDGFVFSGWLPYATALASCGESGKPSSYFKISEGDFFRTLFQLTREHPGMDYGRVMMDDPQLPLRLEEIFPDGCLLTSFQPLDSAMHLVSEDPGGSEETSQTSSFYQRAMDAYRTAIQTGKADVIVTRLPNLVPQLTAEAIPHYVLAPGNESMCQCMERMLYRLESGHYVDMLSVYGLLEESEGSELSHKTLLQALMLFNRREGTPLIVSENGTAIDIYTTHAAFCRLTEQLSVCKLSDSLRQAGCRFTLGWGIGYDVAQAQQNAGRAARLARHTGPGSTYAVDERGMATGPLLSEARLSYPMENSGDIITLSNRYDISRMHIKRILAVIALQGSNLFTSEELAQHLGVSPRSARRILCKLCDTGGAQLMEANETGLRGRPGFRYRITLT